MTSNAALQRYINSTKLNSRHGTPDFPLSNALMDVSSKFSDIRPLLHNTGFQSKRHHGVTPDFVIDGFSTLRCDGIKKLQKLQKVSFKSRQAWKVFSNGHHSDRNPALCNRASVFSKKTLRPLWLMSCRCISQSNTAFATCTS